MEALNQKKVENDYKRRRERCNCVRKGEKEEAL